MLRLDLCLPPVPSENFSHSFPPPLPFEIVSPVEDLLQQGDHGKGADENEEQSSVSQQIPAWRRVSVSHPSERPLKLRWEKFSSLSPSRPFCWEAEGNVCWLFSEQSKDKVSHCSALLPLPCPFWMWAPGLCAMARFHGKVSRRFRRGEHLKSSLRALPAQADCAVREAFCSL